MPNKCLAIFTPVFRWSYIAENDERFVPTGLQVSCAKKIIFVSDLLYLACLASDTLSAGRRDGQWSVNMSGVFSGFVVRLCGSAAQPSKAHTKPPATRAHKKKVLFFLWSAFWWMIIEKNQHTPTFFVIFNSFSLPRLSKQSFCGLIAFHLHKYILF